MRAPAVKEKDRGQCLGVMDDSVGLGGPPKARTLRYDGGRIEPKTSQRIKEPNSRVSLAVDLGLALRRALDWKVRGLLKMRRGQRRRGRATSGPFSRQWARWRQQHVNTNYILRQEEEEEKLSPYVCPWERSPVQGSQIRVEMRRPGRRVLQHRLWSS